jgi:hypothetical protein
VKYSFYISPGIGDMYIELYREATDETGPQEVAQSGGHGATPSLYYRPISPPGMYLLRVVLRSGQQAVYHINYKWSFL